MRSIIREESSFPSLELHLQEGESVFAQPDALVAMSSGIEMMATSRPSNPVRWWGSAGSLAGDEKPSLAKFDSTSSDTLLLLAAPFAGDLAEHSLRPSSTFWLNARNFLAHTEAVELTAKSLGSSKGPGARPFRFFQLVGNGIVFVAGQGELIESQLDERERFVVAARNLVGYDDSVTIEWPRLSREGAGYAQSASTIIHATGPGRLLYQTHGPWFDGLG